MQSRTTRTIPPVYEGTKANALDAPWIKIIEQSKKLTGDAVDNPAIRQNIFWIQIYNSWNPNRQFQWVDPSMPQENQTLESEHEGLYSWGISDIEIKSKIWKRKRDAER